MTRDDANDASRRARWPLRRHVFVAVLLTSSGCGGDADTAPADDTASGDDIVHDTVAVDDVGSDADTSQEAACVPWDDACAEGWCLPDLSGGAEARCVAAGAAGEGEACDAQEDCASGLACLGEGTRAACARVCVPGVTEGDPQNPCPVPLLCAPVAPEIGVCLASCTPFAEAQCPDGGWCSPVGRYYDPDDGALEHLVLVGTCIAGGTLAAGQACALATTGELPADERCAEGLACDGATCLRICRGSAANGCPVGESCTGAFPGITIRDVGTCAPD